MGDWGLRRWPLVALLGLASLLAPAPALLLWLARSRARGRPAGQSPATRKWRAAGSFRTTRLRSGAPRRAASVSEPEKKVSSILCLTDTASHCRLHRPLPRPGASPATRRSATRISAGQRIGFSWVGRKGPESRVDERNGTTFGPRFASRDLVTRRAAWPLHSATLPRRPASLSGVCN